MIALIRKTIKMEDGAEIPPTNNSRILAMDWQISADETFRNPILKSMDDTVNLSTIVFTDILDPNVKWYARARALIKDSGWTVWGNLDVLNYQQSLDVIASDSMPSRVATPIISTNANPESHDATLFTIQASGFSVVGNATHTATSWFLEDLDGNLIWDSQYNVVNKTTIEFRDMVLKSGQIYRIRAMFHSSSNDVSSIGCKTIKIANSSDLELITYLDDVEYKDTTEVKVAILDDSINITSITWQIISMANDYAEIIFNTTTSGETMTTMSIPANVLKDDTMYVLRYRANVEDRNTQEWKYIIFKTINESQQLTRLIVSPTVVEMKLNDEVTLVINTEATDFDYSIVGDSVVNFNKDTKVITGISSGTASITITAQASGKRPSSTTVLIKVES